MAQPITTEDVHRGTFHCQTCDTELPVFYHLRCPKCHNAFTLLPATAQDEQEKDNNRERMVEIGQNGIEFLKPNRESNVLSP